MKKSLFLCAILLSACDDGPKDYLKIAGGGITFNYRYSEAGMVVIAQQKYPLPEGSRIEGLFDIPGQDARQSVIVPSIKGKLTYKLQSDRIFGLKKDGKYKVTIRLLSMNGKELERDDTVYISDQNQESLPTKPLAEGSAYSPHLENLKP
jgi:hypothetical protein